MLDHCCQVQRHALSERRHPRVFVLWVTPERDCEAES
jgi:hypothetical protein